MRRLISISHMLLHVARQKRAALPKLADCSRPENALDQTPCPMVWRTNARCILEIVTGTRSVSRRIRAGANSLGSRTRSTGLRDAQAFLCTDLTIAPATFLGWFVSRWSMETTFQKAARISASRRSGSRRHRHRANDPAFRIVLAADAVGADPKTPRTCALAPQLVSQNDPLQRTSSPPFEGDSGGTLYPCPGNARQVEFSSNFGIDSRTSARRLKCAKSSSAESFNSQCVSTQADSGVHIDLLDEAHGLPPLSAPPAAIFVQSSAN